MNKLLLAFATVSLAAAFTAASSATSVAATADNSQCGHHKKAENKNRRAKASLLIKASPEVVWDLILNTEDSDDTEYSKTLERHGNISIIEEKYVRLPIIGEAVAVIKQIEDPYKTIDFELVKSDKFKAMEGSWHLTPMNNGKETMVELTSFTDTGLPVPRFIIDMTLKQRVKGRLQEIQERVAKSHRSAVSSR